MLLLGRCCRPATDCDGHGSRAHVEWCPQLLHLRSLREEKVGRAPGSRAIGTREVRREDNRTGFYLSRTSRTFWSSASREKGFARKSAARSLSRCPG